MDNRKLKVTECADHLSQMIWEKVITWKYFEKDTVGKQLVRASDSISANLSEAQGRFSYADRKRFFYYARGSLFETIDWVQKSIKRGLLEESLREELLKELAKLSLQLNTLLKRSKNA